MGAIRPLVKSDWCNVCRHVGKRCECRVQKTEHSAEVGPSQAGRGRGRGRAVHRNQVRRRDADDMQHRANLCLGTVRQTDDAAIATSGGRPHRLDCIEQRWCSPRELARLLLLVGAVLAVHGLSHLQHADLRPPDCTASEPHLIIVRPSTIS